MEFKIPIGLAAFFTLAWASFADDAVNEAARALHAEKQDAIVSVKAILDVEIVVDGSANQSQEQKLEAPGTVIAPSGLTVLSNASIDIGSQIEQQVKRQVRGRKVEVKTTFKEVNLLLRDGTEIPSRVVLKDEDLDLAFVLPDAEEVEAEGVEFVTVTFPETTPKVQLLDPIILLNRLGQDLDREMSVYVTKVEALVKKPRQFIVTHNTSTGTPAFLTDGTPAGLFVRRIVNGTVSGTVVLPAKEVARVAAEVAENEAAEEESAPEPEAADAEGESASLNEAPSETEESDGDAEPQAHVVPEQLFECVDPNLEVSVWAHSPLLMNPTNMDIDQHGRIWVAEGVNYRKHFDRRPEGDRIMVLEDTDKDGGADKSWVFVQEPFLRAPMGVAVIGNQVVVSMAPDLLVYTDHDGDAVYDPTKGDTREVLLTGFNGRNHDHSLHSVTVGPDGKWYFSVGNCGAYFTDRDAKTWRIGAASQSMSWWPKDPAIADRDPMTFGGKASDDGRVYVGGFIARMDPDGTEVDILAHNLRNAYENTVTSFGDVFAADNDDNPACRTFAVLEGANYGFASRDGSRSWQADRRPGQDVRTATWRQEDPGVAPAGDVYGGGAPTGIVYYENGALGEAWEGTLLLCEPARNTIFGYRPKPQGEGWLLERFDFLTTNREGEVIGTDYTGGDASAESTDTKTLFRPSDIAVGPDGALYIADWYDPRVGGHNDLDESLSGTIYRVAPKGFRSAPPKIDLKSIAGALDALSSPAVHVRALGRNALSTMLEEDASAEDALMKSLEEASALTIARASWLVGSANRDRLRARMDPSVAERLARKEAAVTTDVESLVAWGAALDWRDRTALERWGMAAESQAAEVYAVLLEKLASTDPVGWTAQWATLAWRLHPAESVSAFKTRALAKTLSERARLQALTVIGMHEDRPAAEAMLAIAGETDGIVRDTALWWLLNKQGDGWQSSEMAAALKERGLYDPDGIELQSITLPDEVAIDYTLADVLDHKGDRARGATQIMRCVMCHRVGEQGTALGPDLTVWGKTQPKETIIRAILDPNADLAHGFYGTEIETHDGTVIQGMLINDGDPITVQSMGGMTQMIPRKRVKRKAAMSTSLMMTPGQLGLTAQDVADIAAFLKEPSTSLSK